MINRLLLLLTCLLFITTTVYASPPKYLVENWSALFQGDALHIGKPVNQKLATQICGMDNITKVDNDYVCLSCPAFTSVPGFEETLQLMNSVYGSFTNTGIKEVIVDTDGCEPHANSFGGAMLLRYTSERWQEVYYQPGIRLQRCIKFSRRNQTDKLLCNEVDYAQGQTVGQFSLFTVDQQRIQRRVLQQWYISEDDTLKLEPALPEKRDVNGDGVLDVRLLFLLQQSGQADRQFELYYLFDGKTLTLDPKSLATKVQLDTLLRPFVGEE